MNNYYTILVHPDGGFIHPFGKPTQLLSPSGIVKVQEGESVTFQIFPATEGVIDYVLVDGSSVGQVNKYTFTNVNSDHTITAKFSY
jgi:hypothetical protein